MPDPTPPVPIIPDDWAIGSALTWTNLGTGLGRFTGSSGTVPYYIYAQYNGAVGSVAWGFGATLPNGCLESLVNSTVAGVLKTGTVQRGQGTIEDTNGHVYSVVQKFDGSYMTAILQ